jgi:hypothetical protein
VKECFAAARNETALGHYQVRKWGAWYRHVTLAMCALAWLAVAPLPASNPRLAALPSLTGAATAAPSARGGPACGQSPGLIPFTVNEIRKLHAIFYQPAHARAHHEQWSNWRRRHQAAARHCHYQRRRLRGY